jgi:tetratricopeptide (TPR) repeat protein
LLAYLGMSMDYTAGREELAALLWGDCSDQQARQSLRQALALLRKELGPAQLCTADPKVVRLDPSQWSIDARDFETLARSRNAEDLSRAARLFAGGFLSGFNIDEEPFEEWVNGHRTQLQFAAGQVCETFVKHPDLVIDASEALAAVEQLLALDPLREDWQRLAIGLRARVELMETKSRSRIWSARYDRAGSDRLMILDDIVRSLSRELQVKITHVEGALSSYDPDAHALIYKGFSAIADTGRLGQPALEKAEKYFTQALAREPANPRALTGLGMYHVQMAMQLFAPDPAPHLVKAEAILLQVIEGHPGVGGPYRLMGVLNIARGRAEAAAQWLQREIEINLSDAPSYAQLGRTMTRTPGRRD